MGLFTDRTQGRPFVPGGIIHQRKKQLEGARGSNPAQGLKSVASDERVVTQIEIREKYSVEMAQEVLPNRVVPENNPTSKCQGMRTGVVFVSFEESTH
jgi:hypothetical protein